MKGTNEEIGRRMGICCELFRIDGGLYELSSPTANGHIIHVVGNRDAMCQRASEMASHIIDVLDRAAMAPFRIVTPEQCINLGARDWWDRITSHATMVRMVAQGNEWLDIPCDVLMPSRFWEKRDNQTIVEIICKSADSAGKMAEQLRRNILCDITLEDPVRQIVYDDGLTVHAFGLSDKETVAMNRTHELVGPCRWERGISIHFGENASIVFGRTDSLVRFTRIDRTVALCGPAKSASVVYASEAAAVAAYHDMKTKPRSRLAVGGDLVQIYCATRYSIYAQGISADETARLNKGFNRVWDCEWRCSDPNSEVDAGLLQASATQQSLEQ